VVERHEQVEVEIIEPQLNLPSLWILSIELIETIHFSDGLPARMLFVSTGIARERICGIGAPEKSNVGG
jgi:hypothetical protein